MADAVWLLAGVVLYPWAAGRLMRHLAPPPAPEGHRQDYGGRCDGDGFWTMGVGQCPTCKARMWARTAALLWPMWVAMWPLRAIYRAGLGVEFKAQPTLPHEQPKKRSPTAKDAP